MTLSGVFIIVVGCVQNFETYVCVSKLVFYVYLMLQVKFKFSR